MSLPIPIISIEVLDGANNKVRAGIDIRLDKATNNPSMGFVTYDSAGSKKGEIQIRESGEIDIYSVVGVWINGTRVGG